MNRIYNLGVPEDGAEDRYGDGPWICYECKDGRCDHCVGPCCQCKCDWPKVPAEPEYSI